MNTTLLPKIQEDSSRQGSSILRLKNKPKPEYLRAMILSIYEGDDRASNKKRIDTYKQDELLTEVSSMGFVEAFILKHKMNPIELIEKTWLSSPKRTVIAFHLPIDFSQVEEGMKKLFGMEKIEDTPQKIPVKMPFRIGSRLSEQTAAEYQKVKKPNKDHIRITCKQDILIKKYDEDGEFTLVESFSFFYISIIEIGNTSYVLCELSNFLRAKQAVERIYKHFRLLDSYMENGTPKQKRVEDYVFKKSSSEIKECIKNTPLEDALIEMTTPDPQGIQSDVTWRSKTNTTLTSSKDKRIEDSDDLESKMRAYLLKHMHFDTWSEDAEIRLTFQSNHTIIYMRKKISSSAESEILKIILS